MKKNAWNDELKVAEDDKECREGKAVAYCAEREKAAKYFIKKSKRK